MKRSGRRPGGNSAEITELHSEPELGEASPIMRELDEQRYMRLLAEMIPADYRLFALREADGSARRRCASTKSVWDTRGRATR